MKQYVVSRIYRENQSDYRVIICSEKDLLKHYLKSDLPKGINKSKTFGKYEPVMESFEYITITRIS